MLNVPLILLPVMLPLVSRTTTVFAVAAVAVSYPSNRSAFKFVTLVVDDTVNGAVPVAMFEISVGAVTLAVAPTNATPKLPTLALPVTFKVPETFIPVLVIVISSGPPAAVSTILPFEVIVMVLLPLASVPTKFPEVVLPLTAKLVNVPTEVMFG